MKNENEIDITEVYEIRKGKDFILMYFEFSIFNRYIYNGMAAYVPESIEGEGGRFSMLSTAFEKLDDSKALIIYGTIHAITNMDVYCRNILNAGGALELAAEQRINLLLNKSGEI